MNYSVIPIGLSLLLGSASCMFINSCVAEGALVSTPRGRFAIESLQVGDVIWAVDPQTGLRVATHITAIRSATRECLALQFGEHALECTPDHPVYSPELVAYVPAVSFWEGKAREILWVDDDGSRVEPVHAVRTDVGLRRVFDLTVDSEHHNFVANGVLVHNKSEPCQPGNPHCDSFETDGSGGTSSGSDSDTGSDSSSDSGSSDSTDGVDGSSGSHRNDRRHRQRRRLRLRRYGGIEQRHRLERHEHRDGRVILAHGLETSMASGARVRRASGEWSSPAASSVSRGSKFFS